MIQKMYSAFISSVYESLKDERSAVIDCLLDYRVFPICMEHFTVTTNGRFSDIEELIDSSDFFILILGKEYGSVDENGISWTEHEYDYAVENKKQIIALICDELSMLMRQDPATLTESEIKQIEFCNKVPFARTISPLLPISRIIGQFFNMANFDACLGWSRNTEANMTGVKLQNWQENNKAFDIGGKWYHVHLSSKDKTYLRIGTILVKQQFDPEHYKKVSFEGYNYNAEYDKAEDVLTEQIMQRSHWTGEYEIADNGTMFGLFLAKREFSGQFGEQNVEQGLRRGIHDFSLNVSENKSLTQFNGEFHDEAPSPKVGMIYVFRSEADRLNFLKKHAKEALLSNLSGEGL